MIQDKISLLLADIMKASLELKAMKKAIRDQEKIIEEEFLELEKASKDLRDQVKTYKENHKNDLLGDDDYVASLNLKMELDEKLAHKNQDLFMIIAELPPKSVNFKLDTEDGNMNVDIRPEMRVYVNGREEKPRSVK